MSGFCHWQATAPVGHSSPPGLLEALLAGGGAPRAEDPRAWGVPALRSPGLGQTSFRGRSPGFPAVGIVSMFGSSRHCRLRSHGRWGDSVYRTELRRHRPPQSEGRSQGPPREARGRSSPAVTPDRPSGKLPHRISIALTVLPDSPRPPLSRARPRGRSSPRRQTLLTSRSWREGSLFWGKPGKSPAHQWPRDSFEKRGNAAFSPL